MGEQPTLFIYPESRAMCRDCDSYVAVVNAVFDWELCSVPLCGLCALAAEGEYLALRPIVPLTR